MALFSDIWHVKDPCYGFCLFVSISIFYFSVSLLSLHWRFSLNAAFGLLNKHKVSASLKKNISTLFDEFPLILNILKRGNERWENLAVRVYRFPSLAASKAQWEYPILTLHIVLLFQNVTLSSILSSFISYIQAAFHVTGERDSVT